MVNANYVNKVMNTKIGNANQFVAMASLHYIIGVM